MGLRHKASRLGARLSQADKETNKQTTGRNKRLTRASTDRRTLHKRVAFRGGTPFVLLGR